MNLNFIKIQGSLKKKKTTSLNPKDNILINSVTWYF